MASILALPLHSLVFRVHESLGTNRIMCRCAFWGEEQAQFSSASQRDPYASPSKIYIHCLDYLIFTAFFVPSSLHSLLTF